jgi:hypothetical protein
MYGMLKDFFVLVGVTLRDSRCERFGIKGGNIQ